MKTYPLIYAVVVTYKGQQWYDHCFGSLQASNLPVHTIVIDNASGDGSGQYLKDHFPELEVMESAENLGFAKANNLGIRKAYDLGADYVFLLNQDAWIEKDTLEKLVAVLEKEDNCGIVSPIHLSGDYSEMDDFFLTILPQEYDEDVQRNSIKESYAVPFVNAAAWLIKREVIEIVGGFDTLLFRHYGEDNNYAQRIQYFGYEMRIVTGCTICHDRLKRCANYVCKNEFAKFNSLRDFRMTYGDISKDVKWRNKWKSLLKLWLRHIRHWRWNESREVFYQLREIGHIRHSRDVNRRGGLVWL